MGWSSKNKILWRILGGTCLTGMAVVVYGALIWSIYIKPGNPPDPMQPVPEIRVTPIHDGIFMVQGNGGNVTALAGPEGILIIDSEEPRMVSRLAAALQSLGSGPVVRVINTHSHGDHRGGNGVFRAQGAEIMAHKATRKNIETDPHDKASADDLPTVTVADGHAFTFNGQRITLHHAPFAHTNGDLIARFSPANVVATGDVFVNDGLPFISLGSGATLDGHLAGQDILLALSDDQTVLIPGHGPVSTRAELREVNGYLTRIRNYIAMLKNMGVSRRMLPLFHPIHAWPPERRSGDHWETFWARRAYDSLP